MYNYKMQFKFIIMFIYKFIDLVFILNFYMTQNIYL